MIPTTTFNKHVKIAMNYNSFIWLNANGDFSYFIEDESNKFLMQVDVKDQKLEITDEFKNYIDKDQDKLVCISNEVLKDSQFLLPISFDKL